MLAIWVSGLIIWSKDQLHKWDGLLVWACEFIVEALSIMAAYVILFLFTEVLIKRNKQVMACCTDPGDVEIGGL